jgi:hypothetical protein
MRVEVFKHLPKSDKLGYPVYSVRCLDRGNPFYGKVVLHTTQIEVLDAKAVVQPAGRDKVRATGVKNVHAFIRGTMVNLPRCFVGNWADVTYNPKVNDTFVYRADGMPFGGGKLVRLGPNGVQVALPYGEDEV